jgi:hypothetical protein
MRIPVDPTGDLDQVNAILDAYLISYFTRQDHDG